MINPTVRLRLEIQDGRKYKRWHELTFDPEKDKQLTDGDFHGISRHLRFRVLLNDVDLSEEDLPDELIVYLGYKLDDWNEEFEIPLHDRELKPDDTIEYTSAAEPTVRGDETPALRFRNAYWTVGKLDLTVCTGDREPVRRPDGSLYQTTIRLECNDTEYAELYDQIRQDVQQDGSVVGLTAPFRDNLPTSRSTGVESPALTLYYRLERILPDLEGLLQSVAREPSTDLVPRAQDYSLRHGSAGRILATMKQGTHRTRVRGVMHTPFGAVPKRFRAYAPARTHDTLANRFVRAALEQILFWLSEVCKQFENYIGILRTRLDNLEAAGKGTPYDFWGRTSGRLLNGKQRSSTSVVKVWWGRKSGILHCNKQDTSIHVVNTWYKLDQHDQKLRELNAVRKRLQGIDALIPRVDHSVNVLSISTATLAFDPRYSALRKKLQEFAAILYTPSVPGSDQLEETPIEPFSEIFERWALQRTADALERLGFRPEDSDDSGYDQLFLNQTYCIPGFETNYINANRLPAGSRLVLAYGKVYPRFSSGTDASYGVEDREERTDTTKRKDAPDIVIEYFAPDENVPAILVLDASLSSRDDIVEDKGTYRKTIRSFYEDETVQGVMQSKRIVLRSYCVSTAKRGSDQYRPSAFVPDRVVKSHTKPLLLPPDREEASRRIAAVIEGVFSNHWS